MTSIQKIEANRRNAQKATGPRTEAGKRRASQNALKHGLLARATLLRDEDPAAFATYAGGWIDAISPQTPMEEALTERAIDFSWRLRRASRIEAGLLELERAGQEIAGADRKVAEVENKADDAAILGQIESAAGTKHIPLWERRANKLRAAGLVDEYVDAKDRAIRAREGTDTALIRLASSYFGAQTSLATLSRYETSLLRNLLATMRQLRELQSSEIGIPSVVDHRPSK